MIERRVDVLAESRIHQHGSWEDELSSRERGRLEGEHGRQGAKPVVVRNRHCGKLQNV